MLYFVWLPLLGIRELLSSYFSLDTLLITILLNFLLLFDLILDLTKNKMKIGYVFLFFIFSAFIVLINKQALALFDIVLAVYLIRSLPFHVFLNYISIISIFNLFLFSFLYFIDFNQSDLVVMPKGDAYNLGFNNTNSASSFLMINLMILVFWVYLKNKFFTLFFFPLFYLIYIITLSRTSFVAEIIFYISIIFSFLKFNFFLRFFPIIIYILTFVLIIFSREYSWINELFTTRFFIYDQILSSMSFFNYLFGVKLPEDQPMDSSFLSLLFNGGIIYVLLFLMLYEKFYRNNFQKNIYIYLPFIFFVLACGFSENLFSSFNLISLTFFKILYDNKFFNEKLRGVK